MDLILPLDAKVAMQAAKLGKTAAESGRSSKFGQSLVELSGLLASVEPGDAVAPKKSGGSLISRLLDVKLPKGAKSKPKTRSQVSAH